MKPEYDFSDGKRGALIKPSGKTRITIYLDDEALEQFRGRAEQWEIAPARYVQWNDGQPERIA